MISNKSECDKFTNLADEWWDTEGSFKPLHDINKLRIEYIKQNFDIRNAQVLDIGCGGGILSESLCKEGGIVTAIDPGVQNIDVARLHAANNKLNIQYICDEIENIVDLYEVKFDLICIMEVLEHIDNIQSFIDMAIKMTKKGGTIILSTINRTKRSYLKAILFAEYIGGIVPKGTHDWDKFIKPSEINKYFKGNQLIDITGLDYNILGDRWFLNSKMTNTNYFMTFKIL